MITAVSIVYKTPAFIGYQQRLLARMFEDEVRYVVVNNDMDRVRRSAIFDACNSLGVTCHNVPWHNLTNPSESHAFAANFAWHELPDDMLLMMDMDIFPISRASASELGGGFAMAGVPQVRDTIYPWPGLFFARRNRMPDPQSLRFDTLPGRDTGGMIAYYLVTHKMTFRAMSEVDHEHGKLIDGNWLHFQGATNWRGRDEGDEATRRAKLFTYLDEVLA